MVKPPRIRIPPLGRSWLPLLVAVLGIAASVAVWQALAAHEDRTAESRFVAEAEEYCHAINNKIEEALHPVEEISALYAASHQVERDEFRIFVTPVLSHRRSIQALEWIPRVPAAQRDAHEEAARGDGFPQYQISEREAQGQMIRAGERDEYFPVYFVEPYEGNEPALGFDLGSQATRLEALNRARDSGEMTVTGRITLVQEEGDQFGFLAFIPVYRKGEPVNTLSERRANLEGFVLGVFRTGEIVEGALVNMTPAKLNVALFDDSAPPDERFLYAHVAGPIEEADAAQQVSQAQEDPSGLYHAATIELGGRQWRTVSTPTQAFLASQRTWAPIGALVAGLIITALVAAYLVVTGQRRRAKEELEGSEEKWRSLAENIPDIVMTVDRDGTILFINRAPAGSTVEGAADAIIYDYVPADHHDVLRGRLESVFETGEIQSYEIAAPGPVGRTSWYFNRIGPVMRDGKVVAATIIATDITERKQAEEALRESEEKFRTMSASAQDAIVMLDNDGNISFWNTAAEKLFGYSAPDALGREGHILIGPERYHQAYRQGFAGFKETGEGPAVGKTLELEGVKQDGTEFPIELSLSAVKVEGKWNAIGIVRDITERRRTEDEQRRANEQLAKDRQEIEALNRSLEAKIKERTQELRSANEELRQRNRQLLDARAQAATDALTGLRNHRAFHERVREEARRAQDSGSPVGLIMLDIDDFKRVNDSQGHLVGDHILRGLASTVAEVAKGEDAYRYGGDEFAVLLPGADGRKTTRVAERLRRTVEKKVNGSGDKVTVSLGIASFPDTAAAAEELIYGADAAMYWAKSAGKNRVGDWGKLLGQREGGALPWYTADRAVKAPDVVAALGAALAAKDPMTAAHTERCSWYTAKLAEELDLPEEETSVVRLASLLHDIGKLAVPDEVLFKPGPLNEEEWAQMKRHSTDALHVLSQIRSMTDAVPAILHHHEHFDGSGYPDGVAGEDIPIASRILLVTDAFDAMTTDRPYRKAMPIEAAIDELKRNRGSQFDPAVVDGFLRMLAREGAQPLRRMAAARARRVAAGAAGSRRSER